MNTSQLVALVVEASPWTAQLDTFDRLLALVYVALLAWLAFDVFDTRSGVTIFPRRWRDVGALVLLAVFVREATIVWLLAHKSPAKLEQLAAAWTSYYTAPSGELLLGWIIAAALVTALTEELVHRALLLPALEGYMSRWLALVVHAIVFDAVHVFVYGYGFGGGLWFVIALIYGYAFQRTRALAVPVVLHASSLLIYHVTIWQLAR